MKKALCFILGIVMALSLAACANTADTGDTTKDGIIGDGLRKDAEDMRDDVENGVDDILGNGPAEDYDGGAADDYNDSGASYGGTVTYGKTGTDGAAGGR